MLDNDPFNNIGDVFATIDGRFQFLINVFPLNHGQRIASFVKESAHGALINIIAFVFQRYIVAGLTSGSVKG